MKVLETLTVCPVCNANQFNAFVESNGYNIQKCKECGILFVNPRPTEESIRHHFVHEYIDSDERVDDDFTSWRQASLKREADLLRALLPDGGRLLDLGTASGAFLGEFADFPNWHVEGLEPSRFAAKKATERYQVLVHAGFLLDQGLQSDIYDAVVSLDAIYFLPNPRKDLKEISRLMKPGGLLAIEIPGLRFRLLKNAGLLCRLVYGVPARLNAGVHLFYYSRETLGKLVGQFGFYEVLAMPEQSPLYGPWYARAANWLYYGVSSVLYRITNGRLNIVPKEFIVYRKLEK